MATMDIRPVPALYVCYLLRSTVRHASLYIGSTPNPQRRLAQHNGESKGGAFRTSRETLRPWEMVCIVTGFPSSIAALQFEWAWQNPHLTRHIRPEERIAVRDTVAKMSKSGKSKKVAKPEMSLKDRLANLHLLLCVPSFSRWPLKVQFFNQDVYSTWQAVTSTSNDLLGDDIQVVLDSRALQTTDSNNSAAAASVRLSGLDVTYDGYKGHLEKSLFILADGEQVQCSVCKDSIDTPGHMALVCPREGCRSASHVSCLSSKFLAEEQSSALVPRTGKCPTCRSWLQWSDLVTVLSLRIRGEKKIAHVMRTRRPRKPKAVMGSQPEPAQEQDTLVDTANEDQPISPPVARDIVRQLRDDPDLEYEDEFVDIEDFDDFDDASSVGSTTSHSRPKMDKNLEFKKPPSLPIVIEDSEYDSAEALD